MKKITMFLSLVALVSVLSVGVAEAKKPVPPTSEPVVVMCMKFGDELQYQSTILARTQAQADYLVATNPAVYSYGFCPGIFPWS